MDARSGASVPRTWRRPGPRRGVGRRRRDRRARPGFLARELEVLGRILDHLPEGVVVVDSGQRIRRFNRAAERITGVPRAEALGKTCREVIRCSLGGQGCALTACSVSAGRGTERKVSLTKTDGARVAVACRAYPLPGSDGRVAGALCFLRDISEIQGLEYELRAYEDRYRRLFEGSRDMIFIAARDGRIIDINEACVETLGYRDKEDLLSVGSIARIHTNDLYWRAFQKQINRFGFIKDFETFFFRKDGTRIHCLLSGNAVVGDDGEVIAYQGIAKDITARMDAVRKLQRRNQELALLNSIALVINATPSLDDILTTALRMVLGVLGIEAGAIFLIDPEKRAIVLRVQENLLPPGGEGAAEIVLHDQDLMDGLVEGALSLPPEHSFPPFRATLYPRQGPPADLTCVLVTSKEKPTGFLAFRVPHEPGLSPQDQSLLGSVGNFLGGAIENAVLLDTVRRHREELKQLTARLFHSQENERKRIARELHDEVGQALTGINFTIQSIERKLPEDAAEIRALMGEVKAQINQMYQEMRRISYRLHPALLSDLGLEAALEAYFERVAKHSGLAVEFNMVGFDRRIDSSTEIVLYRLAQEALTNALKHSKASTFRLSIVQSYPHIIFVAEDDGVGFDPDGSNGRQALGLLSMRERAAMLRGTFSLTSTRGRGTRIRIEIPVEGAGRG